MSLCSRCGKREARFLAPRGKWKSDRQHSLCPQCYRSQRDRDRAPNAHGAAAGERPVEADATVTAEAHMGPTASALEIAFRCCHPWAPGVLRLDRVIGDSELFTAFHEVVADIINGQAWPFTLPAASHALDPDDAAKLARMVAGWRAWWDSQPAVPGTRAEIAYAYDWRSDTARELLRASHRDYSQARPGEFCGTADVVQVGQADNLGICPAHDVVAVVTDWKCGQRRYVTVPKYNPQLRFLALCAARVEEVDHVRVNLAFVDEDGGVFVESADFDAFDLAAIAGEMAALAAKLTADQDPHPGPHCEWCPAVGTCPEAQRTMLELAPVPPPAPFPMVAQATAIQSPEHATWLLQRYRMANAALVFVKSALQGYADAHGGIATGDGATWRRKEFPVEHVKLTPEAKAALEAELPGAVKDVVTKTSIKDAARVAKRPLKATEHAVMALLRSYGVVTTSTTVRYEDK